MDNDITYEAVLHPHKGKTIEVHTFYEWVFLSVTDRSAEVFAKMNVREAEQLHLMLGEAIRHVLRDR